MIKLAFGSNDAGAAELVKSALARSLPVGQFDADIHISVGADVDAAVSKKRVHFGALSNDLYDRFGAKLDDIDISAELAEAHPARPHTFEESALSVNYVSACERLDWRAMRRPFARYDFANEWNNLGFGAIRNDGSLWAIADPVSVAEETEIAFVAAKDGTRICSYAALVDDSAGSVLWFNRPVGPIDSFEWRLVENYLSSYRHEELATIPVLRELPFGHDALIVARLDCDEDIESARALWNTYGELGVRLSLAIHTRLVRNGVVPPLLVEASALAGSVLSHSATHAANWGGDYQAALMEAEQSANDLERATGKLPRYAVSPFHLTPSFALLALADAGYSGCVGGVISGQPEYVMARGGVPPNAPMGFVGLTSQCMLHGDCMLEDGDRLRSYREAFDLAHQSCGIFSYLDHPFSERYSYGWASEAQRSGVHRELVAHIRARADSPLFLTLGDAMDFLASRAAIAIERVASGFRVAAVSSRPSVVQPAVEYGGRVYPANLGLKFP